VVINNAFSSRIGVSDASVRWKNWLFANAYQYVQQG